MNKLSTIQLIKLSDEELGDLIDSLHEKYDSLKVTIEKNVWVGDYGGVSSEFGVQATREIEEIKAYIRLVDGLINKKNSSYHPIEPPEEKYLNIEQPALTKGNVKVFSIFNEASKYAKENPGSKLSRTNNGNTWKVVHV